MRENWLAHCRLEWGKRLVQSYRDNRFNGLFETAAQIHHHRHDIVSFIPRLDKPNLKVRSVLEDMSDMRVGSMLHAVAVVYVLVTGPYWDLVSSKHIPYLQLYRYIQPLADAVSRWKDQPLELLKTRMEIPIFDEFPPDVDGPLYISASSQPEDTQFFRDTLTSVLDEILKTILKQLKDFMPGECYGEAPDALEIVRTKHAVLTNLTCEREFGSLDASQNRRRHSTLHHHSTVVMLKKHRTALKNPFCNANTTLSCRTRGEKARKGGKMLRKQHQLEEKVEQKATEDALEMEAAAKAKEAAKKRSLKENKNSCSREVEKQGSKESRCSCYETPARNFVGISVPASASCLDAKDWWLGGCGL